jgi:hypothetical protein
MEVLQISSKGLISYTDTKRKSTKHGKHKEGYFVSKKWREYNRKKQTEYRSKLKADKPPKSTSEFQQNKQNLLLKLLVNNHSFVPVPQKLKHPIIRN